MRTSWLLLSALTVLAGAGCAPSTNAAASPAVLPAGRVDEEGPSGAPRAPLAWAELDAATFARAVAEKRFVVIDGAAEWCHWCHVMEATTYHDPEVRRLLDASFIAVKVDVDSRPDFEERYGDWGWPATVLMTSDGQEIGKYRGYLAPERFVEILKAVLATRGAPAAGAETAASGEPKAPLGEAEIASVAAWTQKELDEYWDPGAGGWGRPQKVPLAWDNAWELTLAKAGDATARQRALVALDRQRAIVDPVWGGLCQYSTDGDWQHPHYEKLMTYQAGAIDNYAAAYALTRDAAWLRTAQAVRGFVDHFMTGPEGGFYTTMDADLHAHETDKPFVLGKDYYARGDAERRALGIPRVDTHEYGRENGLAIAAYVTLFEASGDATALASAERAAARVLATHSTEQGGILHGPRGEGETGKVLYLADNAAFGFALARLHEATHKPEYLEAARKIAAIVTGELRDDKGGGFFSSTPDPDAVGVFATRRKPFEDDVMAIRFLARMQRLAPSDATRDAIAHALPVVATRSAIAERGRMIGDLLLALEETKGVR
ncbi:MAG TPA: DUF255 domain-containing protein [Polyangiaceae bacterium]|jgi:hypothetical protein